jgi:glycosyltransferase involved in cell wall biosynthesis
VPRVTVIIPTYNWSSVLPWSVGSVLRQSFHDFEVLVVGDGCTDDSGEVVTALGDARVHWINLAQNTRHQSGPNNEGLRQARGELIAYLGHDDLWLPHHLETLVGELDAGGDDLAHAIALNVADDGRPPWATLPDAAVGSFASPLSIVHRRALIDRIGGWKHYREADAPPDVELWRRARAAGARFRFVPRLTAIKFPALLRRDAYRHRRCDEQAAWSRRIEREPGLEAVLLAQLLLDARPDASMVSWRQEVRHLLARLGRRLQARLAGGRTAGRGRHAAEIEQARRYKGLED